VQSAYLLKQTCRRRGKRFSISRESFDDFSHRRLRLAWDFCRQNKRSRGAVSAISGCVSRGSRCLGRPPIDSLRKSCFALCFLFSGQATDDGRCHRSATSTPVRFESVISSQRLDSVANNRRSERDALPTSFARLANNDALFADAKSHRRSTCAESQLSVFVLFGRCGFLLRLDHWRKHPRSASVVFPRMVGKSRFGLVV